MGEIWDQALRVAAGWPTLKSLESLRAPSTLLYLVMPAGISTQQAMGEHVILL